MITAYVIRSIALTNASAYLNAGFVMSHNKIVPSLRK